MACGKKQLTVEEQMTQYQNRIMRALDLINDDEIIEAKGVMSWYNKLDDKNKEQVAKACADIESVRKEMLEWAKTLSEEDKIKIKEFGRGIMDEDYLRKMRHVYSLMRFTVEPAKVEPAK
jgi:predicted metalloprotease